MNSTHTHLVATNAVAGQSTTDSTPATHWTPPALPGDVLESAPLQTTLTAAEQKEFAEKKSVVIKGWGAFLDVANALLAISEKRLYRDKYKTFEAFCKDDLGISRQYAYNLIGSAEVNTQLSAIADISVKPMNEGQFRELIRVQEENRVDVWKRALNLAGNKPMTAKLVRQAAAYFKAPKTVKPKLKTAASTLTDFGQAFELLNGIARAVLRSKNENLCKKVEALRVCLVQLAALNAPQPRHGDVTSRLEESAR
jgi:hypothetical protein